MKSRGRRGPFTLPRRQGACKTRNGLHCTSELASLRVHARDRYLTLHPAPALPPPSASFLQIPS
jgi:hypothetical protein